MSFSFSEDATFTLAFFLVSSVHFVSEIELGLRLTFPPAVADRMMTALIPMYFALFAYYCITPDPAWRYPVFTKIFPVSDSIVLCCSSLCVVRIRTSPAMREAGFALLLHAVGAIYEVCLLVKSRITGEDVKAFGIGWFMIGAVLPIQGWLLRKVLVSPPSRAHLQDELVANYWILLAAGAIVLALVLVSVLSGAQLSRTYRDENKYYAIPGGVPHQFILFATPSIALSGICLAIHFRCKIGHRCETDVTSSCSATGRDSDGSVTEECDLELKLP